MGSALTGTARAGTTRAGTAWRVVAALEVLVAGVLVVADLLVPSLVLVVMAGLSLAVRRVGFSSLGLVRAPFGPLTLRMLAFAAAWTVVQLALLMPLANHLSGRRQDLSGFADVEGDVALLALFLVLSWTLAAFVEELAFRGYLQTRVREVIGQSRLAVPVAVLVTSVLFGLLHTEQGAIGVLVVSLDGIAFSVVRYRYDTVWASVLAHGFNNTIGFVAFFFVGPVYGLW
ncbi:lysostaphin resistance A-like protein [Nocardioides sp.]|uniref:lysostaphin resistance A-like protein n=1 Tax=Nocardioides sp. TaxID=35761 RepID=UPI003782D869